MLCSVEHLGRISYADGLEIQRQRVAARKAGTISDTLLLLEHPHVYTLGRNAHEGNILVSRDRLAALDAEVFETDRGGDVTYHGPGQLVGYPILDLTRHKRDLAWFMRSIEQVLIDTAADFGVTAGRIPGCTGVWIGTGKLAAMGVHVSRWVTSHGFAFNASTDLSYFDHIIPCGIRNKQVTSLEKLLGRRIEIAAVAERVVDHFGKVFALEMVSSTVAVESHS
jgi:lipoyl(octanoyl) transferase